jgi:hypothetical protein
VHRGVAWGLVAALVTMGLLTGRLVTTVSDRVGRSFAEVDQGASGLDVRTAMTSAGSFETASAVVLLVAVVLLAADAVRTGGHGGRGDRGGRGDDGDGAHEGDEARGAVTAGAGSTRRRADAAGLRPAGEHLSGRAVSFGEGGPAPTEAPAPTVEPGRRS